jgi:dihydroorotase
MLRDVLRDTARQMGRAIVMPNLVPPVVTTADAAAYRERILAALPPDASFEPLMTLYLTEGTTPDEIVRAKASGFVHGVKLYPAHATTNSSHGVSDLRRCAATLEAMQRTGMPLLVHGEVTDPEVDVFDREAVFIERVLAPLVRDFPQLKIVLEHITTTAAAEFVHAAPANVAATITVHHLLLNRNAIFAGGLRPHHYCLPVLKRELHRQALVKAAISGSPKFFLGTDSAPHPKHAKESGCGCAGIYTAHAAIELYAEAFDNAGALDRLEAFASFNGADFYGLPRNAGTVTLLREPLSVPDTLTMGGQELVPFRAGADVGWRLEG